MNHITPTSLLLTFLMFFIIAFLFFKFTFNMFNFIYGIIAGIILTKFILLFDNNDVIEVDERSIFDCKNFNSSNVYGDGFLLKLIFCDNMYQRD